MKISHKLICLLLISTSTLLTACGNDKKIELTTKPVEIRDTKNDDVTSAKVEEEIDVPQNDSVNTNEIGLADQQLYRLKGMLSFTSTLNDYDYQNADYSDMVCNVVQQTLLGKVTNEPLLYQDTNKDPLGKWNEKEDSFAMINQTDMDEYMQNYFHISGTVEESQYIYKYEDVYYVWYEISETDYSYIKIKNVKQTEDGKYEISYDVLADAYETGKLCYQLQESRIALVDLEKDNEWSCYYDRVTIQTDENVTYYEINPVQMNDGEWLHLEGIPEQREEASVIVLPNQIKIYDEEGKQLLETNEIMLANDSIIDSSNYGNSVIVSGQIKCVDTNDEMSVEMSNAIVSSIE